MKKEAFLLVFIFMISLASANFAPVLDIKNNNLLACEGSYLDADFGAADADGDFLEIDFSPKENFFVDVLNNEEGFVEGKIISGKLNKSLSGKKYKLEISVSDGELVDVNELEIEVIETNNRPELKNPGVKTLIAGDSLVDKLFVKDLEDDAFSFDTEFLSGEKIFEFDDSGKLNFSSNLTHLGNYKVQVCASDFGLINKHKDISFCEQDGSSERDCEVFQLTLTENDLAPTILSKYPENQVKSILGSEKLFFNVTAFDPDEIIPDVYWYVDGKLSGIDYGLENSDFEVVFGCDVSGAHSVKAEITDGLMNDSVEWTFNVNRINCRDFVEELSCESKWVCGEWNPCQGASQSLEIGLISRGDYSLIQEECDNLNFDEFSCGLHIRNCFDLNSCNNLVSKPSELDACHFSFNPSCFDNFKNCHDGKCELSIDCGGPCGKCETCSDGKRNQGEIDIDCVVPCFDECQEGVSIFDNEIIRSVFVVFMIFFIIVLIFEVLKIRSLKEELLKINEN